MNALRRFRPWIGTLLVATALPGCAGTRTPVVVPESELLATIDALSLPEAELIQPAALDAEMAAWVDEHIPSFLTPSEQVQLLLNLMHSPKDLGLTYGGGFTGTARDVFTTREFNCLSFSHLFVGMARKLGIEAYYLSVDQESRYSREGDLVINTRHVTAGYDVGSRRVTIEFNLGPRIDYARAKPITDQRALALYYSNRGAELLGVGDLDAAVRHFATGVRLDPGLAPAWVNLGVGLRRAGRSVDAEWVYRHAIDLEPAYLPAYGNLAALLRLRGERDAARELMAILDRRENRNPYMYLALGDLSLEDGAVDDARRFYRRAYRLDRRAPDVQAALGLLALREGDPAEARSWLEKARQSGEPSPRRERLSAALES